MWDPKWNCRFCLGLGKYGSSKCTVCNGLGINKKLIVRRMRVIIGIKKDTDARKVYMKIFNDFECSYANESKLEQGILTCEIDAMCFNSIQSMPEVDYIVADKKRMLDE